mmetsp:Transcript_8114/g.15150  ORF Transcript_8114/g.15150 Transcript_8114/m.15150 type:complete len:95 (-) Transcript_8114:11-295(-)
MHAAASSAIAADAANAAATVAALAKLLASDDLGRHCCGFGTSTSEVFLCGWKQDSMADCGIYSPCPVNESTRRHFCIAAWQVPRTAEASDKTSE